MKKILVFIVLLPVLLSAQLPNNTLWKGYGIEDKNGKQVNEKIQQFIYSDNGIIFLLSFGESLNMENGEVILQTKVDTLKIETKDNTFFVNSKDKTLPLEINDSKNIIKIIVGEYKLPFKKLEQTKRLSKKEFSNLFIGNTYYKFDENDDELTDRLLFTPSSSGKMNYSKEYSSSNWSSDYLIIDFFGHLLLKGVSSPPLLVLNFKKEKIEFLELDYRNDPKSISWNIYIDNKHTLKSKSDNNDFELKKYNSFSKCVQDLNDKTLNTEVLVYADNELNYPINHVQHSYDNKWTLFNDSKTRSFKKYLVKDIIKKDSSTCNVFNLPRGYYADRTSQSNNWNNYLHEERIKTDSSLITKKAFKHDNSYRVFNELKNENLTYFEQYTLDNKILKERGMFKDGKEYGTWEYYDKDGNLIKTEIKN